MLSELISGQYADSVTNLVRYYTEKADPNKAIQLLHRYLMPLLDHETLQDYSRIFENIAQSAEIVIDYLVSKDATSA